MKAKPLPEILSPRLLLLQNSLPAGGSRALSAFWREIERQGAPLIEPDPDGGALVTFLYRADGGSRSVAIIQDWGADGIREHPMALLPGTDIWFLTRRMPSDTRTTYQLSPSQSPDFSEPAPYRPDPFNPKTHTALLSENGPGIIFSLLELPDAPTLPWRRPGAYPTGSVSLHTPFPGGRRVWVYLPAALPEIPLPALVAFDGRLYKDTLLLPAILDYLIATRQIPPVAALLVDNADRRELLCDSRFADNMLQTVIPWFRAAYPVSGDPRQTAIVGSSYGGLAAAYLAFQAPHIFGTVFSQTGWFRWRPAGDPEFHWLARQIAAAPLAPLRFCLQVGSLETARMADGGPSQLVANRHFGDTLLAKGYSLSYSEYSGGHDAPALEYPLSQGLIEIFHS